ncbi:hypothetical protein AAKU55_005064 [Oxalobacteraceae bacterium GrIS 1.11]
MKKTVQSLAKKVAEHQADIDLLHGEIARCEDMLDTADCEDVNVAALKRKRSTEVATAFIDRRPPDTASVDVEILQAEKAAAQASADGQVWAAALPIIRDRIESATVSLRVASEQMTVAVKTAIMVQHDSAQEKYFSAIESMRAAVEEMVSCENTWRHVFHPLHGEKFPGRGATVLGDVRSGGLRVRWNHSLLKEKEISSQYLPGFENGYFPPWWADERNTSFAQEETVKNVAALRSAGYPCALYEAPKRPAIEKKDVVHVLKGTILNEVSKIDGISGAKVVINNRPFTRGDTIAFPASEAAEFVIQGFAKYVDGRSKEDAFRFLRPSGALPAHIRPPSEAVPPQADLPQVSCQYLGDDKGEIPASVNRFSPGFVGINRY